jgi:hypothetical protein
MNIKLSLLALSVFFVFNTAHSSRQSLYSPYSPEEEMELSINAGSKADFTESALATPNDYEENSNSLFSDPDLHIELGYMHSAMPKHLSKRIVSDAYVESLFKKYEHLRTQTNVVLPYEFSNIMGFAYGYIRLFADAKVEKLSGISNIKLAHEIIKASFCFGTDPFMVLSKIRRETNFNRSLVSSGAAVGYSQMTGAGIKEVQHQMSGNANLALESARSAFLTAVRCFAGHTDFNFTNGDRTSVQAQLTSDYKLDLLYGQILTKTYLSYTKAKAPDANNRSAYSETFVMYNGDNNIVRGGCLDGRQIEMKYEYACDIMVYYNKLSTVWKSYIDKTKKFSLSSHLAF